MTEASLSETSSIDAKIADPELAKPLPTRRSKRAHRNAKAVAAEEVKLAAVPAILNQSEVTRQASNDAESSDGDAGELVAHNGIGNGNADTNGDADTTGTGNADTTGKVAEASAGLVVSGVNLASPAPAPVPTPDGTNRGVFGDETPESVTGGQWQTVANPNQPELGSSSSSTPMSTSRLEQAFDAVADPVARSRRPPRSRAGILTRAADPVVHLLRRIVTLWLPLGVLVATIYWSVVTFLTG